MRCWSDRTSRVVLGVVLAVVVGSSFASFGAWIGWRAHAGLISNRQAMAVVMDVAPEGHAIGIDRRSFLFGYLNPDGAISDAILGNDDYDSGFVEVDVNDPEQLAENFESIRQNFASLGWQVSDNPFDSGLSARQGDVVASVGTGDLIATESMEIDFVFERVEPTLVFPLTIVGWIFGMAAGWVAARRLVKHGWSKARYLFFMGLSGGILLLPATVLVVGDIIYGRMLPSTVQPAAPWNGYMFFGIKTLSLAGAILIIMAFVLPLISQKSRGTMPS